MSKQGSVSVLNITGDHHPKLEKLTGDFMNMAQESELLNRRLIQCQDDVRLFLLNRYSLKQQMIR